MSQGFQNWSSDEERKLADMFERGATWHEIGAAIGRTWRACVGRARLLDLPSRNGYGKPKPWTDLEIVKLHSMWLDGASDSMIAKSVGRDTKSVNCKRRHLNLSRTPAQGLVAARGVHADKSWPVASESERKRGEKLLDMALGGKPKRDDRPINAYSPPHLPQMHQPHGASIAWCQL